MTSELNDKQRMFVECYLKHFNATQAAKEAGYSEATAYSQGHRLLKDAEVQARLRARFEEAAMSSNEVLYHLAQIARGDITDALDRNGNLDVEQARKLGKSNLIKRVKTRSITTEQSDITEGEAEGYDRLKALELIGKFHAMFTDKVKLEVWEMDAVADIIEGRLSYKKAVELFDDSRAAELFRMAKVPIE